MRFNPIVFVCAVSFPVSASLVLAQEPNFGRALGMTGTELFIGQPVNWYGPGVVYTYRRDAAGEWREHMRIMASDSARMDDFGRALAVDGNTMVVGAPRKRDGSGVVYAFERTAGDWRQAATIRPPRAAGALEFGASLLLSGNELLIAAPRAETTGLIHRYTRSNGEWTLRQTLRPAGTTGAAAFGQAMSERAGWLVIGAPAADSGAGRVFVAKRQPNGDWGEPSRLALPAARRTALGSSVLLDGDRAWVGAPGAATVYVIARDSAGSWAPDGELHPFDSPGGSLFGFTLTAVAGELWVGAPGVNDSNGRVYRFVPDATGAWQRVVRLDADSADGTSWPFAFGYSMTSSGDAAVISMPTRDFGEGRALVVGRTGDAWQPRQLLEGQIYAIGGGATPAARCENGRIGAFPCSNIELVSHMPISALGGERGVWVNDVWGWTDPQTGRDYALVARRDGAAFVDITDPAAPMLIGSLPRTRGSPPSVWRDIKVLKNYAFVVSDGAAAHGMQVFDLERLRTVTDTPAVFTPDTTCHVVHSAHNVVADTASGFLYIVGASSGGETCGGGLHMVDARDPLRPVFAGCYNDRGGTERRGYTHDAQCVSYRGPDDRYRGRQICIGSNETEINIADVTDKTKPVTVGRNSYPNVAYAHQGWFDDEQRYFYMNDELDELAGTVAGTRTLVWDLSRLDDPVLVHEYTGPVHASDHNLFVRGNLVFESNYGSGLRVLDITDRKTPKEIAFFDSAPSNDDGPGHSAAQSGAWSNYPFFRSGIIVFTSVREGLFIVRVDRRTVFD